MVGGISYRQSMLGVQVEAEAQQGSGGESGVVSVTLETDSVDVVVDVHPIFPYSSSLQSDTGPFRLLVSSSDPIEVVIARFKALPEISACGALGSTQYEILGGVAKAHFPGEATEGVDTGGICNRQAYLHFPSDQHDPLPGRLEIGSDPCWWFVDGVGDSLTFEWYESWFPRDLDMPEAWAISRGAGQLVAVPDKGTDWTHPEFGGTGPTAVAGVDYHGDSAALEALMTAHQTDAIFRRLDDPIGDSDGLAAPDRWGLLATPAGRTAEIPADSVTVTGVSFFQLQLDETSFADGELVGDRIYVYDGVVSSVTRLWIADIDSNVGGLVTTALPLDDSLEFVGKGGWVGVCRDGSTPVARSALLIQESLKNGLDDDGDGVIDDIAVYEEIYRNDDDYNGYPDDVIGVGNLSSPLPDPWRLSSLNWNSSAANCSLPYPGGTEANHGTATAGILGARADNEGMVGIAPECTILPLRGTTLPTPLDYVLEILDGDGSLSVDVVSMSFGPSVNATGVSCSEFLEPDVTPGAPPDALANPTAELIRRLIDAGVDVVAAAGNDFAMDALDSGSADWESEQLWVHCFDEVYSVGGTNSHVARPARVTSAGDWIDIAAPASGTLTRPFTKVFAGEGGNSGHGYPSTPEHGYEFFDPSGGTSFAAPIVAGAIALVRSAYPHMSAAERRVKLLSSTTEINYASAPELRGFLGSGDVNPYKALTYYGDLSKFTLDSLQPTLSTTWRDSVWVSGDIHVPADHTLTIHQGTIVHVAQDDLLNGGDHPSMVEWFIEGTVIWDGDDSNPIIFSSFSDSDDSLWISPGIAVGSTWIVSNVLFEDVYFEDELVEPMGGEVRIAGQVLPIIWTSDHLEPSETPGTAPAYYRAETVDIEVSWNGGTDYELVVDRYPVDADTLLWVMPDSVNSTEALVRLHYVDTFGIRVATVESDSTFSVEPLRMLATGDATGLSTTEVPYATLYLDADGSLTQDLVLSKPQTDKAAVLFEAKANALNPSLPSYSPMHAAITGITKTRAGHVADYDGDGRLDIVLAAQDGTRILRNTSTSSLSFSDETSTLLSTANVDSSWSVAFADYDRDGDMDLYIGRGETSTGGRPGAGLPDVLLAQDANGQFVNVSAASGINGSPPIASTVVIWGDANNDGQLDLFVGQGGDDAPGINSDRHSKLLTQYFDPATESPKFTTGEPWDTSGHDLAHAEIRGASWADLDNDGNLDLIVASEIEFASKIHWGDGSGGFSATTDLPVAKGLSIADLDLDGRYEIGLSRLLPDTVAVVAMMKATDPTDARVFTDEAAAMGLDNTSIGSDANFQSILMADVGGPGAKGDGDPDILLGRSTSVGGEFYLENPAANDPARSPQWFRLKLDGLDNTANEGMGTGAIVRVTTDPGGAAEVVQTQIMGQGTAGSPVDELVFGLGYGDPTATTVDVIWPDSYEQSIQLAEADIGQTMTILDLHTSALITSSAGAAVVVQPNYKADWVFNWQTDHSTDPELDMVTVKRDSNRGCPAMAAVTLTPTSGYVTHNVFPIADGKFYHRLTWHNRDCSPGCAFQFETQSATSQGAGASGWKTFSVPVCIN
ncbi:hypothetical protein DRQ53_07605 [bacterium]|nr:MAG: hypothetical protein DRQ53_07605 [bacterium]